MSGTITNPPPNDRRADLERDPRQRREAARRRERRDEDGQRGERRRRAATHAGEQHLKRAAAEEDEDEPRAERRGRDAPGDEVGEPADPAGGTGAPPARRDEGGAGPRRDGGDRRARARAEADHPAGRGPGEEEGGERQDEDEPGEDERRAADESPCAAAKPPGAVDGQLGGRRAGEEVARGDGVLELLGAQPAALVHAEAAKERDVGRGATEARHPDAAPFGGDHPQRRGRGGAVAATAGQRSPVLDARGVRCRDHGRSAAAFRPFAPTRHHGGPSDRDGPIAGRLGTRQSRRRR